MSSPVVVSW